jgi:hypothetical protein
VVFFPANGYPLLGHVIFRGTMHRCLPPSNERKIKCSSSGWHLTLSENHWYIYIVNNKRLYQQDFVHLHTRSNPTTCMSNQLLKHSQE